MTTNERIAEFLGKTVTRPSQAGVGDIVRLASGALFVVDHAGMFTDGYNNAGDPWDPEHDIRCWHGEHGILAKIEEKGLRGQFLRQLGDGTMPADQVSANKSAEANLQELLWRICRAEAPQLAAALVKVIEEAPMPETKFGPLSSLVGRTFERDGKRRTVTRVELWTEDRSIGDVYWARPGMKERTQPIFSSYFETWLCGATEVKDGQG